VAEIERVVTKGVRALLLPLTPGRVPYSAAVYDPIWQVASAHGCPVSFHCATSTEGTATASPVVKELGAYDFSDPRKLPPGMGHDSRVEVFLEAQRTLTWMTAGGTLERFPELRVVVVECDAGWFGWLMDHLDRYDQKHAHMTNPLLTERPSVYQHV
jgi:predicted TIM-barrel fold metal-dependent hydrolase